MAAMPLPAGPVSHTGPEVCATCKFFATMKPEPGADDIQVCCRLPPVYIATGSTSRSSGFNDSVLATTFPTTQIDWWCGEYIAA